MNTTQIKCFISLGKTLNYTRTAEELFMSQPTVTKNIQKLEAELGVQLVEREKGRVSLTANGRFFWQKVCAANQIISSAISQMSIQEHLADPLTIGYTNVPFERAFLPKLITYLNKQGFQLKLQNLNPSSKAVTKAVDNKEVDLLFFQEDLFKSHQELAYTPLFSGGFSVIVPKESDLNKFNRLTLPQLAGQRLVLWQGVEQIPAISQLKMILEQDYPQVELVEMAEMSNLLIYVASSQSLAIVPNFLYDPDSPDFQYIRLEVPLQFNYSVGYRREFADRPYFAPLIRAIQRVVRAEQKRWNRQDLAE